jgi:hypothetical protein
VSLYAPGTRVRLVYTDDPWTHLPAGTMGTVTGVDDAGTVHIDWDNGSRLGMVVDCHDRIEVIQHEDEDR